MMVQNQVLPLDQIWVSPDRVRKVDENKAFLIGHSIASGVLIHPITVRPTPEGERPYTLVAGATRHRGHELHGLREIDCIVRSLDARSARKLEVEENLFRADLNKLERALHVVEYRKIWEEEHGEVARGNPDFSNSANLAELGESSARTHFFEQALDDLGLSRRAIERAQFIGSKLTSELREALRQKPEANNQGLLEKLAGLEANQQRAVAASVVEKQAPIVDALREIVEPAAASEPDRNYTALAAAWSRAGKKDRDRFLALIGATIKAPRERMPKLSELMAEGRD